MFFIFGALEQLLRMSDATVAYAHHHTSRRVMLECRQWEHELGQTIDLAYSFWGTAPMIAQAIVQLKVAMDTSRQQAASKDVDSVTVGA